METAIKMKIAQLKAEAIRCRQKAKTADSQSIADNLNTHADDVEEEARQLERLQ